MAKKKKKAKKKLPLLDDRLLLSPEEDAQRRREQTYERGIRKLAKAVRDDVLAQRKAVEQAGGDPDSMGLVVPAKRKRKTKQSEPEPLTYEQRLEAILAQTRARIAHALDPSRTDKQFCINSFLVDPVAHTETVLSQIEVKDGHVQLPRNWQHLLAPYAMFKLTKLNKDEDPNGRLTRSYEMPLKKGGITRWTYAITYDFFERPSAITKRTGHCSKKYVFDRIDSAVYSISSIIRRLHRTTRSPRERGLFDHPPRHTAAMKAGTAAHKHNEEETEKLRKEFQKTHGVYVGDSLDDFFSGDIDAVLIQEERFSTHIDLGQVPYLGDVSLSIGGTPDKVLRRNPDGSFIVQELKTNLKHYSPIYFLGCVLQGLFYSRMVSDYVKAHQAELIAAKQDPNPRIYLLLSESKNHLTEEDLDCLLDGGTTLFLNKQTDKSIKEGGSLVMEYGEDQDLWVISTAADSFCHRFELGLYQGSDSLDICNKLLGGCASRYHGCDTFALMKSGEIPSKKAEIEFYDDK